MLTIANEWQVAIAWDVRIEPTMPAATTRNPFVGKGLSVTIALLSRAPGPARLVDLAADADASPTHVTRTVRALRAAGLVAGSVTQGRDAAVVATAALFWRAAEAWPAPAISLQGGTPPDDRPMGGGPVAAERFGIASTAPPCVYVRHRDELAGLVAMTGGALVSEPVAEWQVAVVDHPFDPGPLPDVALALELGRTPRGREELEKQVVPQLLAGWPGRP